MKTKTILGTILLALIFTEATKVYSQEDINQEMVEWAQDGNLEQVKIYIEKGADVNYIDNTYRNSGVYALWNAEEDEGEMFRYLKDKGLNLDFKYAEEGSYLHIAAKYDAPFLFKLLIDNGLDINRRNNNYDTPLLIAAGLNDFESVKELISLGADLSLLDKDDLYFFELMDLKEEEVWNLVMSSNLNQEMIDHLLILAIEDMGDIDRIKQTIEKGANVNQEVHEVSILTYFKGALEDVEDEDKTALLEFLNYLEAKGAH